jgi:hypothetical protein
MVFPQVDASIYLAANFLPTRGWAADHGRRTFLPATNVADSVSETPLPAALPLFATGLGAISLLTYRKRRKQA